MADDFVTQGLYDLAEGDSNLVSKLGTYKSAPCIFTAKVIPTDAPLPYLWMPASLIDEALESKDIRGREIFRDIWIVAEDTGDSDQVMDIATDVRNLYHRAAIPFGSGRNCWLAEASGPVDAPTGEEDTVTARIVTVRFAYTEL